MFAPVFSTVILLIIKKVKLDYAIKNNPILLKITYNLYLFYEISYKINEIEGVNHEQEHLHKSYGFQYPPIQALLQLSEFIGNDDAMHHLCSLYCLFDKFRSWDI